MWDLIASFDVLHDLPSILAEISRNDDLLVNVGRIQPSPTAASVSGPCVTGGVRNQPVRWTFSVRSIGGCLVG
jgi:hypothetical protein